MTFRAAADAFARTERPDESSWPYVAAVGLDRVAVRWAAVAAPEPEAPWRTGPDPRLWTADRADLAGLAAPQHASRPLVIGEYLDSVVFLNTSRAPGPIVVEGAGEGAQRLRELISRQMPDGRADGVEFGAWWPMQVEDGAIYLVGLALATLFAPARAEQAGALVIGAALRPAPERAPEPMPEPVPQPAFEPGPVRESMPEPEPEPAPADQGSRIAARRRGAALRGGDAGVDDWLRQLRATADDVEEPVVEPEDRVQEPARPEPAPAPPRVPAPLRAPAPAPAASAPAPEPVPGPAPEPADESESLEDWESGFAVSSAEHAQHTE